MRNKRLIFLVAVAFLFVACGGGDEGSEPTATSARSAGTTTPVSTVAVTSVPVATGTATVGTAVTTGTSLDKALPYYPYELDNVKYGGTFRRAVQRMMPHFDPKLNNQTITEMMRWTYEKLVGWVPNENDAFSHFEPVLAETWTSAPDLKTYTFNLRKGVKWQNLPPVNGRELVASDVVFSMNRYLEKDSIYAGPYSQVESITNPDQYTVVIKLKEPNAWLFNDIFPNGEYVVAPEVVKQGGGTIPVSLAIGTGPYMVKEYAFNIRGVFVRNPNAWNKDKRGRQLPYTDQLELIFASDPATLVAGMRTSQLDVTQMTTLDILNLIKSRPDIKVFNPGTATAGSSGIAFNTKKAPWNDVRVRRAVSMALDRDRVAQSTQPTPDWTYGKTIHWNLVSDEPFAVDKLGQYLRYNPQESKKLRIEAGFPDGKIKVPSPFTFAHPSMTLMATTYQALLKPEGIEFELEPLDFSTYAPYYYQRQFKDIAITFQNGNDGSLIFTAVQKFQKDSSQNTSLIDDPAIEQLIKDIRVTTDPAKLRAFAKTLWDYDTQNVFYIWPPQGTSYMPVQPRVRNWTLRANDAFTSSQYYPWLADAPRNAP